MNRSPLYPAVHLTRRRLVQQSAAGVLGGTLGHSLHHAGRMTDVFGTLPAGGSAVARREARAVLVDPADVRALAMRAIDAAKSAGVTYADVRLTRTVDETIAVNNPPFFLEVESNWFELSVRALVNGYWGFAATPYWNAAEVTRVATAAVAQAKTAAKGPARHVELAPMAVATGHWTTPGAVDPFGVPVEEKLTALRTTFAAITQALPSRFRAITNGNADGLSASNLRQERTLATTDGSYVTQTVYQSGGGTYIRCPYTAGGFLLAPLHSLTMASQGWEFWTKTHLLLDELPRVIADLEERATLPITPVEIGRCEIVCDAMTMAQLVDATFGRATQVDRALGYCANADGTSYLGPDPLTFLGTTVAHPMITVTADRSRPAGLATVQWDDEGVRPAEFPLVHAGTLVDYQTTREQATWLAPWYARQRVPVQSHGCAATVSAGVCTTQLTPNLTLAPASGGATFETLVSGVTEGIAVERAAITTDAQCRTGTVMKGRDGHVFHVKKGKRVALVRKAGLLFNAADLWHKVTALGGPASAIDTVGHETKGALSQRRGGNLDTVHSVRAVPAVIENQVLIDITRTA